MATLVTPGCQQETKSQTLFFSYFFGLNSAFCTVVFNPGRAEPGYALPLQTVWIQISWLLQKPTDLDPHCLSLCIYMYVNLYQQPRLSYLIGWKLEVGVASKFIQHDKGWNTQWTGKQCRPLSDCSLIWICTAYAIFARHFGVWNLGHLPYMNCVLSGKNMCSSLYKTACLHYSEGELHML